MSCKAQRECPVGTIPYVVRDGDSIYKIALLYGTSPEAIISANVDLNMYNLAVGKSICVPVPQETYPSCRTTNYYIVEEGDTFFSIARKFGVSESALIASNSGVPPENIFTGLLLCIPPAPPKFCIRVKSDGSSVTLIEKSGGEKTFPARLDSKSEIVPSDEYILTQKRLESGAVAGAKELLFSPYALGIRGSARMNGSEAVFIEVSDEAMYELFNSLTVGTALEAGK